MNRLIFSPLCLALLLCFAVSPAWSAPVQKAAKHVYLLDVMHGAPAAQTDTMLKGKGFTELRKKTAADPTIYNIIYKGKMDGAEAEAEVIYYKGVTLGVSIALAAKTPEQKKSAKSVYQKMMAAWTKAYGQPDKPLPGLNAWLLDNDRVTLNLGEPSDTNPSYLLMANRPYLD